MLDASAAAAALQSLECLANVFSWVPLHTAAAHAPASLLTRVFHFATLGCRPACDGQAAVAEAALCCINELVGKNQVPSSTCEQFILGLFTDIFSLLKSLLHQPQDTNEHHLTLVRFDQLPNRSVLLCIFVPLCSQVVSLCVCAYVRLCTRAFQFGQKKFRFDSILATESIFSIRFDSPI